MGLLEMGSSALGKGSSPTSPVKGRSLGGKCQRGHGEGVMLTRSQSLQELLREIRGELTALDPH